MNSKSTSPQGSRISFSMEDFEKALDQHDYQFNRGQTVKGKVSEHTSEGAYIDIGGKSPGFVPSAEANLQTGVPMSESLPLGEELDFLIVREQNEDGQVTLSRRQLSIKQAWENILQLYEDGETVQIKITNLNKGGVIGEVEGLRGFIPRSHLLERDNLESLVGQSLGANFLEVNRDTNKIVLSQRQLAKAAAISKLTKGSLVDGLVVKIQPYGVFIDLDGVTGLLHIKQVSNARIESLESLFAVGQKLKVVVFEVDEYKNRVSLITKVLESYPGEIIENITEVMSNAPERLERALLAAQEQERLQLQQEQEAEQAQEIEEQVIAED
jgi:small subunit ribosomal protein S1